MRHILLSLCLVLPLSVLSAQNDTTALARINYFAKNLKAFDKFYTQEKVYLHLDNNGYMPGETIWFKAYVFRASTLLPTDVSKVLYVEILSPHGQVIEQKTLPIFNGRTYGDFKLDKDLCNSGFYEVRAYTRAMLNWDDAFVFSRVVPIYEEPVDTINFTDARIAETVYSYRKKNNLVRTAPEPLTTSNTQKKGNVMLSFFPEGGYSTVGQASTIAYKLTDAYGLPLNDSIIVCDAEGKVLTTSRPSHDGMGSFCFAATPKQAYAVVAGKKSTQFQLPEPRTNGADLHITQNADRSVTVSINASESLQNDTLGISVMCRSQLGFFQCVVPSVDGSVTIKSEDLKDGVNQITLFTPYGEILSERLVWAEPQTVAPKMRIAQNQDSYGPFSPVVLDISLVDSDDKPLQGDFSISVRDANTEMRPDYHSLQTEMLLSSELKGYINNPEYYFAADNGRCKDDLDLLLMVQGWRRYSWKQMAGKELLQVKQPIEDGLLLFGDVTKSSAAKSALEKDGSLSVNFLLNTSSGARAFTVNTDNNGNYAVELPKFYGDASAVITVTDKKDKRVYTNLRIQRNFSPSAKPYEPLAIAKPQPLEQVRTEAASKAVPTFEWADTIPDVIGKLIKIGGVTVKARKSIFGYDPISGVKRGSGENVAKRGASYYYDIPRELDKYLDQGNAIPNLWEWLATVNPSVEYYPTDGELYFNGRIMKTLKDIDKTQEGRIRVLDPTYPLSSFRSLIIVENIDVANKISRSVVGMQVDDNGEFNEFSSSSTNAVAYLFSCDPDDEMEYYKRGTRWATLHGYSKCDEFYSPDYRLKDMPTPADHRRTLYWNPSLTTDENGKADVIFYSNSRDDQRLHIVAEGIGVNGQMFEYR